MTDVTPQPQPGPRAQRLQDLYTRSLQKTLSQLSYDKVAGCYPTISKKAEAILQPVQKQMVEKLQAKCEREFENILSARQVVEKLNELEHLVDDARNAKSSTEEPIPPHTLPPQDILKAHLQPTLKERTSLLDAQLQSTQAQNALLIDEVKRQRQEIESLLAKLEDAVEDVKGANEALSGITGELAAESRNTGV